MTEFTHGESVYNIDNGDNYRYIGLSTLDPLIAVVEHVFVTGHNEVDVSVIHVDFDTLSPTLPKKFQKEVDNSKDVGYSSKKKVRGHHV